MNNKLSFEDGQWWAIETLYNICEEGAATHLLRESNFSRDDAVSRAKKSGFVYPQIINYFDVFVWDRLDIDDVDDAYNLIVKEALPD